MKHVWNLPKIEYVTLSEYEEMRDVALIYSSAAWEAVRHSLHLPVVWSAEVREASEESWAALIPELRGDVIYAVGGGLSVDTAKYLSLKTGLPLICIPTALSVDAFLTWASGVRRGGSVYYIETRPPDRLIIDLAMLGRGPAFIRAAGICDVLSIATGLWDWRFAEERGQNPPATRYIPYVDLAAQAILTGSLDCADAAGRGDEEGLKQLLDCLALEVQLCNLIGHSRPEEGSEHYFAYSVENIMGKGLPHGDLVGPGILLIAALQGQDIAPLRQALLSCHIPLTNIPTSIIHETILTLPAFSRQHGLAYGIAHELTAADLERLPALV
ncbi:iron-containing alcohol dehydrogenase [Geitlerinema splendidum]|jgi:glycerol-1-phosphate dehydrogenase [NAD(P)+]|nr:iron-containing alcohol dehydrogenase [Geitlerinema splendidum]